MGSRSDHAFDILIQRESLGSEEVGKRGGQWKETCNPPGGIFPVVWTFDTPIPTLTATLDRFPRRGDMVHDNVSIRTRLIDGLIGPSSRHETCHPEMWALSRWSLRMGTVRIGGKIFPNLPPRRDLPILLELPPKAPPASEGTPLTQVCMQSVKVAFVIVYSR